MVAEVTAVAVRQEEVIPAAAAVEAELPPVAEEAEHADEIG